jgi:PBP1b-binding outer membrane lipoprotein LpoB
MSKHITSLAILLILIATSCTKKESLPPVVNAPRTITFVLYTEKDFSSNDANIRFSVFIKNHTNVLFDSTLPTMKIKEIPTAAHKLIIEKKVPNDDGSDLSVGFLYSIENVGSSWHIDTCASGASSKVVEFAFE